MSTPTLVGRYYQPWAVLPFVDQQLDYFSRNCRVVGRGDHDGLGRFRDCAKAAGNGYAHLAGWVGISSEDHSRIFELLLQLFCTRTLAQNDYYSINPTGA